MDEESLWLWCSNSLCCCVPNVESLNECLSEWSSVQRILWLLHSFRPDLIPLDDFCTEVAAKSNSQKLLQLAETQLGVPFLLDASETTTDSTTNEDDLAFFTYQALLYNVLENRKPNCQSIAAKNDSNSFASKIPKLKISHQHFLWCPICQKDVRLFERFFVDGKARHRKCFQCQRCRKLLHVGLYRSTRDGCDFECLDHEKDDLVKKLQDKSQNVEAAATAAMAENFERVSLAETKPDSDESNVTLNTGVNKDTVGQCCTDVDIQKSIDTSANDDDAAAAAADTVKLLYPQLPAVVDNNRLEPEQTNKSSDKIPTAPPRKKKPDNVATNAVKLADQKPPKPLPPARTKLQPKLAVQNDNVYPEDKNPFGDDDDDDKCEKIVLRTDKPMPSARTSLSTNPFGSDDDINGSISSLSSDNPFNDSDYDSEIAEASRRKSLHAPESVPRVVRSDMTKSFTAGTASSDLHRSSSRSPNSTLTKKRPAPPPPPSTGQRLTVKPASKETKVRKKRPAPPPPLPFRRQIRSEITMSLEEIVNNLASNDGEILNLEEEGRQLEDEIRQASEENTLQMLIPKWLNLIKNRMELVRQESEFAFLCRERQLDELHAEIEYQLRCIIEKPESEKREDDGQKEAYLLQKLLNVIDEKSRLAESDIAESNSLKNADILSVPSEKMKGSIHEKEVKTKKRMKLRLKKLKKKLISSSS